MVRRFSGIEIALMSNPDPTVSAPFVLAADYDTLAAALRFAREALDLARTGCACSVPERASGHHVDCYVPQIKEAIEAADLALAHAER